MKSWGNRRRQDPLLARAKEIRENVLVTTTKLGKAEFRGIAKPEKGYTEVRVYFGTDRARIMNETTNTFSSPWFSTAHGTDVAYGNTIVTIPKSHHRGEIETPSFLESLLFKPDRNKYIYVINVQEQGKVEFLKSLAAEVNNSDGKKAFIFVHGYNVSFKEAARRTAQMAYDMEFAGAPIFYSWPSWEHILTYSVDEDINIKWSQPHLQAFFDDVASQSSAEEIYVIAHSLGAQLTSLALESLFAEKPELRNRFTEIALMAPDIDANVFENDIAPRLVSGNKSDHVTVYASKNDKALLISTWIHRNVQRLGNANPHVVLVNGVESIDASDVATDFIGHSYYGDTKSVVADLFEVVRNVWPLKARSHLVPEGKIFRFKVQ